MDLKGYSAWISVDGTALKEYNIEVSNGNKATCWIASEAGKMFSVNWRDSNRSDRVSGFIHLDGILCGGKTVPPTYHGVSRMSVNVQMSTISTSIMTEKPFLFSSLELTDDDSYLDRQAALTNLGEISVEIWRVAIDRMRCPMGYNFLKIKRSMKSPKKLWRIVSNLVMTSSPHKSNP